MSMFMSLMILGALGYTLNTMVLFGLIMVLTQKLNPQPPNMDPMQQNIMKVMPVMFSLFFIFFPSALALYSVVNGAVSLVQQRALYKRLGA